MIFLDKAAMRFENGNNTISDTKLKIVFAFAIRRLGSPEVIDNQSRTGRNVVANIKISIPQVSKIATMAATRLASFLPPIEAKIGAILAPIFIPSIT